MPPIDVECCDLPHWAQLCVALPEFDAFNDDISPQLDNYVTLARLCYMKNFTSSTGFCPTEYRRICGLQIASAESDLLAAFTFHRRSALLAKHGLNTNTKCRARPQRVLPSSAAVLSKLCGTSVLRPQRGIPEKAIWQ